MKLSALGVALALIAGPTLAVADDLDDALAALKQAEPSKDPVKIKELVAALHAVALKTEAPPTPDVTDKDAYDARAKYAKEVDTRGEYALFALAAGSAPATALDLIAALEKQNPKSQYLDEPEILAFQADSALSKNQLDRALGFANRLIAAGNRKAPEGEAAASWETRRNTALSRGYWTAGVIQGQKQLFKDADRNLRAALPLIKGNNAMMGPALFFLGVANYNIAKITLNKAKMQEAAKFSQECAAIAGPYQDQAYKNALNIKKEADAMR
ncbi:MAG: hypothetical protein LAP40_25880 [Acidobacteriia bacterium]|nr:hypothetical protein [Terriglobia bacterium]